MIVERVRASDSNKPTPDTEWSVRELAGHMLYELSWTADLVRGATMEQVGDRYDGDLIGNDLAMSWQLATVAAETAIEECDLQAIAHLSYSDVTVEEYLREAAGDQLIHAWDLGVATGQSVQFDSAVTQAIYDHTLPRATSMYTSGLFAPPIEVSESADLQTRLLGLFGRDARWQPVA
jgi:uncharacterized protein (TIGR03086 family)